MFLDEIAAASAAHPSFRSLITVSQRDGSLTMEQIAASSAGQLRKDIYMCGPVEMTGDFQSELRNLGVPISHIHVEQFTFR